MSVRQQQIASTVKRAIQEILVRGLNDPRIQGLVTVTEVEVSKDLRHADVKISVYPDRHEALSIKGLEDATLRVQRALNDRLHMRRPPHIRFVLDRQFKKQAEVLEALRRVAAERDPGDHDLRDEFAPPGLADASDDETPGISPDSRNRSSDRDEPEPI